MSDQDWRMLRDHQIPGATSITHVHGDGRACKFSNPLGMYVFEGHKQCLRSHALGYGEAPALPYPESDGTATQGHSGSETSRERAREEVSTGTVAERQAFILRRLEGLGAEGETVQELRDRTRWHHGQASSVLSVLHKEGKLARLTEVRNRCKVYVLPEYVNGRDTEPHGRRPDATDKEWEAYKAGWMRATHRKTPPGPWTTKELRTTFLQWKATQ